MYFASNPARRRGPGNFADVAVAQHWRRLLVGAMTFVMLGCSQAASDEPPASAAASDAITADGAQWTPCAREHDPCTFNGTARVMYGTPEHHAIKSFTTTAACDNGPFDDPAPGVEKRCWVEARAALKLASPAPSTFKAPPGPATTLPLDCTALPASEPAPAQGDAVEADTPGSDGTRMFASGRPVRIVFTTRAPAANTLVWQVRDAWDTVKASGRLPVAAGALTHAFAASRRRPATLGSRRGSKRPARN